MLAGSLPELVDHRKLAKQQGSLSGSLPVVRFTRFAGLLAKHQGEVYLELQFDLGDRRQTTVSGTVSARITLECQNCLEQYEWALASEILAEILPREDAVDDESERDAIIHADPVIAVVDLVEDELILAVPMIPRHEPGECGSAFAEKDSATVPDTNGTELTYRPFAGLATAIDKQEEMES